MGVVCHLAAEVLRCAVGQTVRRPIASQEQAETTTNTGAQQEDAATQGPTVSGGPAPAGSAVGAATSPQESLEAIICRPEDSSIPLRLFLKTLRNTL